MRVVYGAGESPASWRASGLQPYPIDQLSDFVISVGWYARVLIAKKRHELSGELSRPFEWNGVSGIELRHNGRWKLNKHSADELLVH